jgi:amino acid transporter
MAETTMTSAAPGRSSASLAREIGVVGMLWASVGSIIGSGWLFGAQKGLIAAGPSAVISWVIGGFVILLLALVHAELGAMYPVSGGSARFPHYAFGGVAGASFGWFSWLQAVTVAPIEVTAVILYMGHYDFAKNWLKADGTLTHTGLFVAVVIMAILTAVNLLGVRALALANSSATWWKVGVPLATIFVVCIAGGFHPSNFHAADGFAPHGSHGILAAIATSGIIFSYLGFEQADQLAGESKNPKRDIPIAVIGSIVLGLIIYIGLQVAFLVALPQSAIGDTWDQMGNGLYTTFTGPWAQLAALVSLGWLATILYIDAVISPAGTGLIYFAAASRVSYGLARNSYFNSVFDRLNKARTPWVGVITAFIAGCVCFLPFPSWQSLVGLITSASVLMYAGAPLSLGVFRRQLPDAERPWKLPFGEVISPAAFAVASLIIFWTGWETDWKLGILIVLGSLFIFNREFSAEDLAWRSAVWLPVYLVGLGVITYISTFGPLSDPFFNDWSGMAVVAVFAVAIYYWALATSLKGPQIQHMIDDVVIPEEDELGPALSH